MESSESSVERGYGRGRCDTTCSPGLVSQAGEGVFRFLRGHTRPPGDSHKGLPHTADSSVRMHNAQEVTARGSFLRRSFLRRSDVDETKFP